MHLRALLAAATLALAAATPAAAQAGRVRGHVFATSDRTPAAYAQVHEFGGLARADSTEVVADTTR
jgi:hypothetical protein